MPLAASGKPSDASPAREPRHRPAPRPRARGGAASCWCPGPRAPPPGRRPRAPAPRALRRRRGRGGRERAGPGTRARDAGCPARPWRRSLPGRGGRSRPRRGRGREASPRRLCPGRRPAPLPRPGFSRRPGSRAALPACSGLSPAFLSAFLQQPSAQVSVSFSGWGWRPASPSKVCYQRWGGWWARGTES